MDFRIDWPDEALCDLRKIVSFIARRDPVAAERIGERLLEHVELLRTFPRIGPAFPRGTSGPRHEIVCGTYRIFYEIIDREKLVRVLTIRHGSQEDPNFD